MKRTLLIVCGLIIVLVIVLVISRLNSSDPNTTFKKEVMDRIGNREVSAVKLIRTSDDKTFALRDKEDISQILDAMAPMQLEKINKPKDTTTETYSILLLVQGKLIYNIFLYDKDELQILDMENNTNNLYKIKSTFDLSKIKNYWD